jgi:hypothetical protein
VRAEHAIGLRLTRFGSVEGMEVNHAWHVRRTGLWVLELQKNEDPERGDGDPMTLPIAGA